MRNFVEEGGSGDSNYVEDRMHTWQILLKKFVNIDVWIELDWDVLACV